MYYSDKINSLKRLFNCSAITINEESLTINAITYPIINDVIILLNPARYTPLIKSKILHEASSAGPEPNLFSEEIQFSFGEEWKNYNTILDEHKKEFSLYFDLVNLNELHESTVADLGCGIGRWSYFLADHCKEMVLVDFSDAVFEARRNLSHQQNCLFFMADIQHLPFTNNFADLLFCLGVLHHLPNKCLEVVRNLKNYAPQMLIYLYYSLDNRPVYFRYIFTAINFVRLIVSGIRNPIFRKYFSKFICLTVYFPVICAGTLLSLFGVGNYVPLYEGYYGRSLKRIEQDVYDRFFTSIEQRVSRKEIAALSDTFDQVIISPNLPFWHFLCKR
jgi:SAM-dependent methyltransferase